MHPLRIKENWVFLWQLNNLSALFCREELSKQSEGEPYISRQSSLSFFISRGIILPDYSFVYTFSLKLFLLCFSYLDIYTAFITVDCGHLWVSAQFCPRGFLWKKKLQQPYLLKVIREIYSHPWKQVLSSDHSLVPDTAKYLCVPEYFISSGCFPSW